MEQAKRHPLRRPVMQSLRYMGTRILSCEHVPDSPNVPLYSGPGAGCPAGICIVPPEPSRVEDVSPERTSITATAPYAAGDLDTLLAAFHGEAKP
jgi:hypothetical protein